MRGHTRFTPGSPHGGSWGIPHHWCLAFPPTLLHWRPNFLCLERKKRGAEEGFVQLYSDPWRKVLERREPVWKWVCWTLSKWFRAVPWVQRLWLAGIPMLQRLLNPAVKIGLGQEDNAFLDVTVKHWVSENNSGVRRSYVNSGFTIYQLCEFRQVTWNF